MASPVPDTRMPKSVPLRLMAVTTDEPSMPRAGSVMALAIAMATLRKNWSFLPMKSRQRASVSLSSAVRASAGASRRSSRLEQATFRWCISSPMVSPRAMIGFERDAAGLADGAAERRPQRVAQPGQARQHLGVVAAEAHDLAQALVDGAVGAIAEGAVLDHQDGLAARGHAGHRPDGVVAVIGLEPERAAGRLGLGIGQVPRPALEHRNAGDGAAQRPAHALPADRRPRMQDVALAEPPNRLARRHHVDEHRIAREHAPQRLGIGGVDLLHAGTHRLSSRCLSPGLLAG